MTPFSSRLLVFGFAVILTILLPKAHVFAQSEREFIIKYNEHIDPQHRLDTINLFILHSKVDAEGVINNTLVQSNNTSVHKYFSDGTREVVDEKTNMVIDDRFHRPKMFKNAIMLYLGFISPDEDSVTFKFLSVNDSTAILEKKENMRKIIYTFDTKTNDLLQTEKINQNGNNSITTHVSYQNVSGILVPKVASVSGNIVKGTMKHFNVSFHSTPKNKN